MNKKRKHSQLGHTLIEVMIAGLIFAVLILAVAKVYEEVFVNTERNKLMLSRDQIVILTRQLAGDIRALRMTLTKPENAQFRSCVCGGGCVSMQTNPLSLYDWAGEAPQTPNFYDASGFPCDPARTNCYIQVTTTFLAECRPPLPTANPVPPANCNIPAEFVQVIYSIRQNPTTVDPNQVDSPVILKPIQGGVFTQVEDIAPGGVCP
ncbi:MAG: prepilin-type N-terminal cleavage/methylation domain-containing protein [Bdellovibrionales bacterium]